MADQHSQHGRRPHFHRGRRGQDRRGNDPRGPGPAPSSDQVVRDRREHVDVEQIMREIRSRISQRHGIELTTTQIQELAARRLEAILDPRTVKPSLLEQIRRSTTTPVDAPSTPEPTYSFEDTTIYDSHRASLRFIRRLLNPLLRLFFNPNPLSAALNTQARMNQAAAQRESERERQQTEWNALHYEILQRLVLEVARTSLESQQLAMRVEALGAKVDFAERRARSIEGALHQTRPARHGESAPSPAPPVQPPREPGSAEVAAPSPVPQEGGTGEGGRRRRRRRRGRRPQGFTPQGTMIATVPAGPPQSPSPAAMDSDEPDDEDAGADLAGDEATAVDAMTSPATAEASTRPNESAVPHEPAIHTPIEATAAATPEPAVAEPLERQQPPEPVGD
jgi:hypothetical protein